MEKLKPKLFSVMKSYTKEQFVKDVIAGIIVAIIALPLSIALALASGVTPEKGIYTAITAGFVISFLGGSRVQIAGPTAAFATIVAGIVAKNGMDGLIIATLLAGVILILMGFLRLGNLIKFIPYTITTGFTSGIAVTIFIGQIKDFLGLTIVSEEPLIETMDKLKAVFQFISTTNVQALLVGVISLLILILILWQYLPGFCKKIPPSLIAVLVGSAMVALLNMNVNTIGDLYEISNKLPTISLPSFSLKTVQNVLPDAFTIAILAAIESLLSCVVADSMVNSRHRSNMELIAQGAGNITSALFGGIPATGAIARTAANVKNGGRTPIAGMVHSVTLLLILVVLMPYAALIPMPTIAAILFMVAYNMCDWRKFVGLCRTAPKSDIIVLVTTFVLTVVFDLVVAIEVGILLAAILFMKRMSDVTEVEGWKYVDDEDDADSLSLRVVPHNTMVYEVSGPLFFGAADKILKITLDEKMNCLVLRMRSVSAIDATAMHNLEQLYTDCKKKNIQIILSHVGEQPMHVMEKSGFLDKVGRENVCAHIDDALECAARLG
jgi:SulP family sulfate permease